MKKIAKLSLVAAVAVAGLTTANAQPLEEAIKNVDVSGSVVYRYNDYQNNKGTNSATDDKTDNNYKIGLNLSSKVNDDVKFNSRFVVGKPSVVAGTAGTTDSGFATLNSSSNADQNVDVQLSHANFAYTGIANTTVVAGKQGLTTPWTVALDSDGNEQTGTGLLAMSTVGPVTLAGAYFNQTNLNTSGDAAGTLNGLATSATNVGTKDIATVGVIGAFAPVTLDAWYLDLQDTFNTYTVGAKVATTSNGIALGADARYVSLELDGKNGNSNGDRNTLAKLVLTADAGLVDAKIAYAMTGKDGGLTALDQDATTTLLGWNLTALNKVDADYWQAVLGFDILSNLNLSANYGNVQYKQSVGSSVDMEDEEIYGQLLYKMTKNFSTYVRYGQLTKETANVKTTDGTAGRLQVEYTF